MTTPLQFAENTFSGRRGTPRGLVGDAWDAITAITPSGFGLYGGYRSWFLRGARLLGLFTCRPRSKWRRQRTPNTARNKRRFDENYGGHDAETRREGSPLLILYGERMVIPIIQSRNIVSPLSGKESGSNWRLSALTLDVHLSNHTAGDLTRPNHAVGKLHQHDVSKATVAAKQNHSGIAIYNGVTIRTELQSYAGKHDVPYDGNTTTYATLADVRLRQQEQPCPGTGGNIRNFYLCWLRR